VSTSQGYVAPLFATSGGLYLSGAMTHPLPFDASSTPQGGTDFVISKVDATGAALVSRLYGGPIDDIGSVVTQLRTGELVLVGRFAETASFGARTLTSAGDVDAVLARLTADGRVIEVHRYGDELVQTFGDAATGPDGRVVAGGTFAGTIDLGSGVLVAEPAAQDLFVAKLPSQL
jgi:hypothetical protein